MQHAIFVSYRREDAPDAVGRVYDRLVAAFGEAAVFKDVDTLPVGENFGAYIAGVIARCSVTLVLIGPRWASSENDHGRRLEDYSDWVRIEVETALTTSTTKVVPVLVSGASLPSAEQLPQSLRPLLGLNAAQVRRDPDFHQDMSKLITTLGTFGVIRVAVGATAASVWSAVRQTEDVEEHRYVIDTFPGTVEAFEARCRVDQLIMVKALRKVRSYLQSIEELDDEEAPASLLRAWLLIEGADLFEERWADTLWDNEILDLRKVGCGFLEEHDLHYDHELQVYDYERYVAKEAGIEAEAPAQWLGRVNAFFEKLEARQAGNSDIAA